MKKKLLLELKRLNKLINNIIETELLFDLMTERENIYIQLQWLEHN
jgi:hypothetical protein